MIGSFVERMVHCFGDGASADQALDLERKRHDGL